MNITLIILLSFIVVKSWIQARAGLLVAAFIPGPPAGVVFVAPGVIITRLTARLRGFMSYPYIISFEYKNAFKRRLKGFKGHISHRIHTRPGHITPAVAPLHFIALNRHTLKH